MVRWSFGIGDAALRRSEKRFTKKILLTGFDAFGSLQQNPSELVVRQIAERARAEGRRDLVSEVLPTQYAAAGKRIRQLIRRARPRAVLCLGVAESRTGLSLERVALNLDDSGLPDNAGRRRSGRAILRNGPPAYWSTLPLERLRKKLAKQGIPVGISNHAGTFVCNHVFYVARHETERLAGRPPCGLIHVPLLSERREKRQGKSQGLPLGTMVEAVECCLAVLRRTIASG